MLCMRAFCIICRGIATVECSLCASVVNVDPQSQSQKKVGFVRTSTLFGTSISSPTMCVVFEYQYAERTNVSLLTE